MYSLMTDNGAPPQEAAKYEGDQKCAPHRYWRIWPGYSWRSRRAETPLREPTSLETATPPRPRSSTGMGFDPALLFAAELSDLLVP